MWSPHQVPAFLRTWKTSFESHYRGGRENGFPPTVIARLLEIQRTEAAVAQHRCLSYTSSRTKALLNLFQTPAQTEWPCCAQERPENPSCFTPKWRRTSQERGCPHKTCSASICLLPFNPGISSWGVSLWQDATVSCRLGSQHALQKTGLWHGVKCRKPDFPAAPATDHLSSWGWGPSSSLEVQYPKLSITPSMFLILTQA